MRINIENTNEIKMKEINNKIINKYKHKNKEHGNKK